MSKTKRLPESHRTAPFLMKQTVMSVFHLKGGRHWNARLFYFLEKDNLYQ